jgi:hypothetical protein
LHEGNVVSVDQDLNGAIFGVGDEFNERIAGPYLFSTLSGHHPEDGSSPRRKYTLRFLTRDARLQTNEVGALRRQLGFGLRKRDLGRLNIGHALCFKPDKVELSGVSVGTGCLYGRPPAITPCERACEVELRQLQVACADQALFVQCLNPGDLHGGGIQRGLGCFEGLQVLGEPLLCRARRLTGHLNGTILS